MTHTPEEARILANQVKYLLSESYHQAHGDSEVERENCGSCALHGYNDINENGYNEPNYSGWARVYVQARMPIPHKYAEAFIAELDSDNKAYSKCLRDDITYFGLEIL